MAMPENDFGVSDVGNLLRDIGRSSSLTGGTLGAEAELMRAAHDPLLVRRLVTEREGSREGGGTMAGWCRSLPPTLAVCTLEGACGLHHKGGSASCRYEAPSGRLEPSLNPIVFAPDAEDRFAALDLGLTSRSARAKVSSTRRLIWLSLGTVLVLGFCLVLV